MTDEDQLTVTGFRLDIERILGGDWNIWQSSGSIFGYFQHEIRQHDNQAHVYALYKHALNNAMSTWQPLLKIDVPNTYNLQWGLSLLVQDRVLTAFPKLLEILESSTRLQRLGRETEILTAITLIPAYFPYPTMDPDEKDCYRAAAILLYRIASDDIDFVVSTKVRSWAVAALSAMGCLIESGEFVVEGVTIGSRNDTNVHKKVHDVMVKHALRVMISKSRMRDSYKRYELVVNTVSWLGLSNEDFADGLDRDERAELTDSIFNELDPNAIDDHDPM